MNATQLFRSQDVSVIDYRCSLGPADRPFAEEHRNFSLSYVRKGGFSCRTRGRTFDLVAGAIMVGRPDAEYMCSHEHHVCGDECLSFYFAPEIVDTLGRSAAWDIGAVPPLASLIVIGELAQAAAEAKSDVALDEVGMILAARFASSTSKPSIPRPVAARDRRRAAAAAIWINEHASEPIDLASISSLTGLSSFHFLRCFAKTIGVTPHQYLLRCRLQRAARLLADDGLAITEIAFESGFNDLSNFIRTFRRAAGVSPRAFRRASKADRKKVQERLGAFLLG